MEYKEQIREEALTYLDGSKIDISAQAGIYAYFFTHSAKFLKNNGRMGYITSNTWLDVSFGEGLKRFFLERFKILAVIEHDAGVFEKAVVDTCVLLLKKAEGEFFKNEREENKVKFIRVKKPMDIKKLITLINEAKADYEDENIRIILKRQSELDVKEKWGKYLRAPRVYYKLIQSPYMTKLEDIAKVRRGYTTGAEDFFYLSKDKIKLWGIEDVYYQPVITSPRKMQFTKVSNVNLDECLLKVEEPKNALKGKNVAKYIEHGESQGYHLRQTTSSRSLWYKLTEREPAPIVIHRFIRERLVILWNDVKAYVDDSFYEIIPNDPKDIFVLLSFLSSSLLALIIELHGRLYGAGLFEIKVYELKKLPMINPKKITRQVRTRIKKAFLKFCEIQLQKSEKALKKAEMELDNAIFDAFGFTKKEREEVYEGLKALRKMRLQRKEVEVLVETAEKWKPRKKRKKERKIRREPSKRLDMWMKD